MAGDPLSTIRSYVYDRVDISQDDAKFGATTMSNLINMALRQVSARFDPWWLLTSGTVTTTVGDTTYDLSTLLTRFRKVQSVVDNNGFEVLAVNKREISRYLRMANASPAVYVVKSSVLTLAPPPDSAVNFTVEYYQNESPLVSDTDQPALPVEYTDWLVVVAGRLAAIKNRDQEMVQRMEVEIKRWEDRITDDLRQMKANPRIVLRDEQVWG